MAKVPRLCHSGAIRAKDDAIAAPCKSVPICVSTASILSPLLGSAATKTMLRLYESRSEQTDPASVGGAQASPLGLCALCRARLA